MLLLYGVLLAQIIDRNGNRKTWKAAAEKERGNGPLLYPEQWAANKDLINAAAAKRITSVGYKKFDFFKVNELIKNLSELGNAVGYASYYWKYRIFL